MRNDLISKQAAIDAFNTGVDELIVAGKGNADAVEKYLNGVINMIKELPSVESERKWIPVSERLPDKEDVYLCCSTSQDIWILRYMMPYYFKEGAFIQFDGDYPEEFSDVIAWMPLPEPWRGEEE